MKLFKISMGILAAFCLQFAVVSAAPTPVKPSTANLSGVQQQTPKKHLRHHYRHPHRHKH